MPTSMSTPGPDIQAGNSIPLTSQNLNSPPTRHDSSASLESLEPSKSLPPTWFTRWFVDWWLLEILSWCFGVVCMIIITVVLSLYNGSELPKWHLSISLNAILTIFSGLAKSALLVPVAEALGQLKWDWCVVVLIVHLFPFSSTRPPIKWCTVERKVNGCKFDPPIALLKST